MTGVITDQDFAVTGGTGAFLGTTGTFRLTSQTVTPLAPASGELTLWVPKLKAF